MVKVLVIDDEEHFCRALKIGFAMKAAFQVTTTTLGEEGIRLAKKIKPDIILLDIMMPDISGPEVAEQLADDQATSSIPIIFVTAIVKENEVKENNGLAGKRIFIAKPVKIDELIKKINEVLSHR